MDIDNKTRINSRITLKLREQLKKIRQNFFKCFNDELILVSYFTFNKKAVLNCNIINSIERGRVY